MFEEKEIALGDRRAKLKQLGAADARHVARRLVNVIGDAIRSSGSAGSAKLRIQTALGSVLAELDDGTIDWLTEVYAANTLIERSAGDGHFIKLDQPTQDALFGGGAGLVRWMEWLKACVEFSVGDFFRAAGDELKRHLPEQPAAPSSASPSTLTGSSTASPRPSAIGRVSTRSAPAGR